MFPFSDLIFNGIIVIIVNARLPMSFAIIAQQAGLVVAQGFAPNYLKHKADSQVYFSFGVRLRSGNTTGSYQGNQFQSPDVQPQSPVPPDATFWHLD